MSKKITFLLISAFLVLSLPAASEGVIALVGGRMIDGLGGPPVRDAVVIVRAGRIEAAGPAGAIAVPKGSRIVDLGGKTILPGFIDSHVHRGFDEGNLAAWAAAGVTTVRDLNYKGADFAVAIAQRKLWRERPELASLLTVGPILCAPGGYGAMSVESPADARKKVRKLAEQGADAIKFSIEDGYAGTSGLPKLSAEEMKAIVDEARSHGLSVIVHVTQARFMREAFEAGADQIAHDPYDWAPGYLLDEMAARGTILIPTFSVYRGFGVDKYGLVNNLARFVAAGGIVAFGDDYMGGPGPFELGMPLYEIEAMAESGMDPMRVIVACTRDAARACGKADSIGTLEKGKIADILVLRGDPLTDLSALREPVLVMHNGAIIRGERE